METIKETVKSVIQSWSAQKNGASGEGPGAWMKKILTKKEFSHIKVHYLRKGTLGIKVDSSAWAYALNLRKQDLLAKLRLKSSEIKDIRFSLGEIDG